LIFKELRGERVAGSVPVFFYFFLDFFILFDLVGKRTHSRKEEARKELTFF